MEIGANVNFSDELSPHYVTQFDFKGTAVLPGILSMAYFIHSAVTTLGKNHVFTTKIIPDFS